MPSDTASRSETTTQIFKLARFAIACTLGMAAVLLLADVFGRGWSTVGLRFLSENVVIALICATGAEVAAAIAAATCIALWKQ